MLFHKYNISSENQYGFHSWKSTELAMSELIEEISTAIDNKMSPNGDFVELRKQFIQ